ncbi:MAG: dienelactone hydrolase family protein [Pseudomonadota bacterium]
MNTLRLFAMIALLAICHSLAAEVVTEEVIYRDGDTEMRGMLAYDNATEEARPGILVVHEWWGQNDYARERARMLAELGYTALAVDMYGDGKMAEHPDDAGRFASAVAGNAELTKARFEAALAALREQPTVAQDNIVAIGYCFGGAVVLNMARMGTDINGVVSYHGSLATGAPAQVGDVKTRVLVFNGAADPLVPAEDVEAFKREMEAAGVDFEFIDYPGVLHSFTNPGADAAAEKFGLPVAYDAGADKDSWERTQVFFDEVFADQW